VKKIVYILLAIAVSACFNPVMAKKLGDLNFPNHVEIPGTHTRLQLNGVGYRTKFFFKIYAGALYTKKRVSSRDAVQALNGPKRVVMHFIYGEVGREKLVDAWNEGFEDNTSAAQFKKLQPAIRQFDAMFADLKKGDIVLLDYIPGVGTRVSIKGKVKGVIKGRGFNTALLDIWLGDEPADDDLKEAMLASDDSDDEY